MLSGFWQQLTPEERRAAGLDHLTPAQQAALDQQAERFAREGVRQVSEQSKQEIREQAKREVREEVKQELKAEEKAQAVAKAGLPAEQRDLVIRSRIAGKFDGWSGATVFRLENGQTWAQSNSSDRMWFPAMENPKVEIRPSTIGGWKLYLVDKGFWLRVRRVK